jgi:UDP-N-acetylmuramyl pentapeptide phosphotransferase/UDP-N-acetylglucosamine-1-phosphate transferase
VTNRTLAAPVLTGVTAAIAASLAYRALRRFPPGGEKPWARVNHRGEPVTLLEGPAVVAGSLAGTAVAAMATAVAASPVLPSQVALALSVAGGGAAAFGALDDLKGSGKRRGLRGHLGALRHGEVTTGAVKLAGIGATGTAAALILRRDGHGPVDCAVNAALIAGGANLLNLFDLRPGRAIKVMLLAAGLIGASGVGADGSSAGRDARAATAVAAPVGAALALLPADLREQAMLGDAGANALGAMLGVAAATALPRPARIGLLAGIVALTGLSEKVSFTRVIARTPALNWLDMLGRRPLGLSSPPSPPSPPAVPQ